MTDYLIDGVKILNINPPEEPTSAFIYIMVIMAMSYIVCTLCMLFMQIFEEYKTNIIASLIISLVLGGIFGYLSWAIYKKNALPETYDVLIDESVSFRVFDENYEVVERKGSIYTSKERAK